MGISLSELRQNLFALADRVAETGEPLTITRKGVGLRLVREESGTRPPIDWGRLKGKRAWVIGPPLDPHFSPAQWTGEPLAGMVKEPAASRYRAASKVKRKRK
jgi:hypothetical protein